MLKLIMGFRWTKKAALSMVLLEKTLVWETTRYFMK